jgi:hypothetical protein
VLDGAIMAEPDSFVELRKAWTKELDNTRYLPSFTELIAYITTKKAKSKVTKSA